MDVRFVAEISSNHNQDIDRIRRLVGAAAGLRCYGVKFQLFKLEELFVPEVLRRSSVHRLRCDWELAIGYIPEISKECKRVGLKFGCTPFYLDAVAELYDYVDFYKIASYELTWPALLREVGQTKKPVVLSTGMATLGEVRGAVEALKLPNCTDLTLLHCVSGYPTPPNQCNLSAIQTLRDTFNCKVGWSDHSVSEAVVLRAIYTWDAEMVEFHLDLDDGKGRESGKHCWPERQAHRLIRAYHASCRADGDGIKRPAICELAEVDWRADPSDGLRPMAHIREMM